MTKRNQHEAIKKRARGEFVGWLTRIGYSTWTDGTERKHTAGHIYLTKYGRALYADGVEIDGIPLDADFDSRALNQAKANTLARHARDSDTAKRMIAEHKRAGGVVAVQKLRTVGDLIECARDKRRRNTKQSRDNFERQALAILHFTPAKTRLSAVTTATAEKIVRSFERQDEALKRAIRASLDDPERKLEDWSGTTIKNYLTGIKATFAVAVEKRAMLESPFKGVDLPDVEEYRDNDADIPHDLAQRLIAAALTRTAKKRPIRPGSNELWAGALALARGGALRLSEVRRVRRDEIDPTGGKGGRALVTVQNVKNRRKRSARRESSRVVELPDYYSAIVRQALDATDPEAPLFIDTAIIRSANTLKDNRWLAVAAGVDPIPALWQNCRRQRCRELVKVLDINAYCRLVDHSIHTAYKYYLAVDEEQRSTAADIGPATTEAPTLRLAQ